MKNYFAVMAVMPQIVALMGMIGQMMSDKSSVNRDSVQMSVNSFLAVFGKLIPKYKNLSDDEIAYHAGMLTDQALELIQDIKDKD